jgi:hypothetical protein
MSWSLNQRTRAAYSGSIALYIRQCRTCYWSDGPDGTVEGCRLLALLRTVQWPTPRFESVQTRAFRIRTTCIAPFGSTSAIIHSNIPSEIAMVSLAWQPGRRNPLLFSNVVLASRSYGKATVESKAFILHLVLLIMISKRSES